jgi:hypothetical protein
MYAAHARHAYVLLVAVMSVGSGLAFLSCVTCLHAVMLLLYLWHCVAFSGCLLGGLVWWMSSGSWCVWHVFSLAFDVCVVF